MQSKRVILGAAVALLSALCYAPAFAQSCPHSDSLQLGDHAPKFICEGSVEGDAGAIADAIDFASPILPPTPITTDLQITLTEPGVPGPNNVSDFVNVDPILFVGDPRVFGLDVTLVSDGASLLNVAYGQIHIPETGSVQNLDLLITGFYGWDFTIPAVNVISDT